jgi:translation elongation factor EF-1beta
MKNKIKILRELMEKYDLFSQDDEVGFALKDLETEINMFKEFEIYSEDFAHNSLEEEVLFKKGTVDRITILYKDESNS